MGAHRGSDPDGGVVTRDPSARWGYRIQSGDDGGCTLVEEFTDRRGKLITHVLGPLARGVRDTLGHNRAGMEKTVAKVKAVAEAAR